MAHKTFILQETHRLRSEGYPRRHTNFALNLLNRLSTVKLTLVVEFNFSSRNGDLTDTQGHFTEVDARNGNSLKTDGTSDFETENGGIVAHVG